MAANSDVASSDVASSDVASSEAGPPEAGLPDFSARDAVAANLPTPALLIDARRVQRNLDRLAAYAARHGLRLRPHAKTHKLRRIAALQRAAGAIGLTVAKAGEAEELVAEAFDLLVAYPPVDGRRAERLARLARDHVVRAAVDSRLGVELASAAAVREGATLGLLVDLDVGLGRTGLPTPAASLELAQYVDALPGVRLDGLFCYPGHIWALPAAQAPQLARVDALLAEALAAWQRSGLPAEIVSGGSTPTAFQSHLVPRLTEIRPGTYVFNDLNTVRGGFCALDDCALRISCTVVSDAVAGQVVLDAGSKTLTSDRCVPAPDSGYGYVCEHPEAVISRLSEEHAQVDVRQCAVRPRVGERVTVIPNHVCPCVNLPTAVWWCAPGNPPEPLRVDARGLVA